MPLLRFSLRTLLIGVLLISTLYGGFFWVRYKQHVAMLNSSDSNVRRSAIKQFKEAGYSLEPILDHILDENGMVREASVNALIGSNLLLKHKGALVRMAKTDKYNGARCAAVRALIVEKIYDDSDLALIRSISEADSDELVRSVAAHYLELTSSVKKGTP